jgi:SpoVK/Ycf46/Vps4 family AAA+-type ATPase
MTASPYNSINYLIDELNLLDARLGFAISRLAEVSERQDWNEYSGLYISEKEVECSLKKDIAQNSITNGGPYDKTTTDKLNRLEKIVHNNREQIWKENSTACPLYYLSKALSLSPFELNIIIACLAPEIDSKYEKLYAYLHNDVTRKKPSMGLILDLLCTTIQDKLEYRRFFSNRSVLFKFMILEFDLRDSGGGGATSNHPHHLLSAPLKLDEHIINFILGTNEIDTRIRDFSKLLEQQEEEQQQESPCVDLYNDVKEKTATLIENWQAKQRKDNDDNDDNDGSVQGHIEHLRRAPIFYFSAPYGAAKKTFAKSICQMLRIPLLTVDINGAINSDSFKEISLIIFREALLHGAVLYLDHFDLLLENEEKGKYYLDLITKDIAGVPTVVTILSGEKSLQAVQFKGQIYPLTVNLPPLSFVVRKRVWESLLKKFSLNIVGINISDLAGKFRFTPGQIKDSILTARNIASLRDGREPIVGLSSQDLYEGCRLQSNVRLATLAQKVATQYFLNDIILPNDKKQQLKEILNFVKHKDLVYSDWGFENKLVLGKGLNILFAGESGTGKTMAAQIIANELNLDLYKIDLSSVVSKYIGETEKNINRIFKEAETSNAILFFDEADALFGKRSEIRDAHDRYANIEINYLLQKLEEHREIVILASNLAKNIDDAFVRRMHFWIDFPFPDEKSRLKIWQNIFPKAAPLDTDVDFPFLARQFHVSGGIIKNIALNAAFLAADSELKFITMNQIINAIRREFDKVGKPCLKSDFGKYYDEIISKDLNNKQ